MRSSVPFAARLGRVLFALLCAAGALAGLFLFLCAVRVVDPAVWQEVPQAETVLAPALSVPAGPPPFTGTAVSPEDLDRLPASGGVVLPMKLPSGALGYVSRIALAADCGASSADPRREDRLREMNRRDGLHTAALVSCLRDEALTAWAPSLALHRPSGAPWRDGENLGWLDPRSPQVRDYLAAVCRELAWLGFDELILADLALPPGEDLREELDRAEALDELFSALRAAVADLPVRLSVEAVPGQIDSGQTPALLARAWRVWCRAEDQAGLAAFSPAVLPPTDKLTPSPTFR